MGRVARAGSSNSGKAGAKNIGITRTKRRKRKDLEKLHRNVLEAKRNLRLQVPRKKKKKTTLEKVLNNFADKRQETEDICQGVAEKKDKKKKPKTICNRLLPETIFGIYQNGTKGHKVIRENRKSDKINEARLQDDVLKLLNGDETNPNVNRKNGNKKKFNSIEGDELVPEKNEQPQFLQRENNCKRRLFEPNEDQTDSNRLGNAGNSSDFVMGEIRFSPFPGNARDVLPSEDYLKKKNHMESMEVETWKKTGKKLMPNETTIDANFWGWSPTIYYERLCAMVCAENFENNQREQPSGSDPLVKIRSTLREFYRSACRDSRWGRKTVIAKGNKRREQTLSKVCVPLKDSSLPSTGEIQACITDSEMDQESSDSGVTKVGSWRPKHFARISNPINSGVAPEMKEIFESKIHKTESDNISEQMNEQVDHCEKTSNSVEKTINSVALFLENLRKNNPLNEKTNFFEDKDAVRIVEKERNSSDDSATNPPENLTFDMNQRNSVRRNTKHVPTILRRSNSRCNVLENVDEKFQPLPPNNWLVSAPKRSTRTFAALPRRSDKKIHDPDHIQTPSIVKKLSAVNKTKADILKTKSNFMRAKYRFCCHESLSSEYQELGNLQKKHAKNVAKNRKEPVSEFFANGQTADHRKWYPTDFGVHSHDRTPENRQELYRTRRRVNFDTHDDYTEEINSQIEKGFSEDICNFHSSNRHENSHYDMQKKLTFELPCPEIPKNVDPYKRRVFTNEMENISSQRLTREDSEEMFIRPRYLAEDSKTTTRGSRISSLVSASRCGNEIQFAPEAYEHVPISSETKDEIKNRSFKPLPSYHANTLSVDRLAMNEATGCAQRCRGVALRQRIRKPVVVFRPIQETRQQQEICDSRYRLTDNGDGTINDAVRNFRVLTFDDNNINQSASQHQPPKLHDLRLHAQPQQQQSLSQSHCHQKLINMRKSKDFDNQPTKYLAFDGSGGKNPRRLPIFVNPDGNQAANGSAAFYNHEVESTKLLNAIETPETPEIMCLNCHDGKNPRLHATRVQCYRHQQERPEMAPCRTSEVTLMLPCSASLCQQAPTNNPETTATLHGPTSIQDIPRVVYSTTACKTLVPVEMTYQLKPPLYSQSRYDNEKLSKRVQLPDGRVGILVTENGSIDISECLDSNADGCSRFKRIDMGKLNDRNRSGLANDRIYY